jgi:hypothetical protein
MISVHHAGACHFAKHLICEVPARDKIRKSQPFFVMEGYCSNLKYNKKTHTITLH